MDKIRKKLSKATNSRKKQTTKSWVLGPSIPPVHVLSEPVPEIFAHGLFILHPTPELRAEQEHINVDIVAVHGLNGRARETWEDEQSGMLWLEDFLPEAMPNARIMTFGYNSNLLFGNSTGRIEDFARDLLNRLWFMRQGHRAENRPLVFIAHSLGGIVVKKALILAHENQHQFGDIISSTIGIVFMGTPHRGSEIVNWTAFLQNLARITSGTQLIRTDLIQELGTHSSTLLEISESFLPLSIGLNIMSFIELQIERPLTTLVVPEESARLNIPNERVFPVNTHHRNICRYSSKNDPTYVLVEGSLKYIMHRRSNSFTPSIFNQLSFIEGPRHTQPISGVAERIEEQTGSCLGLSDGSVERSASSSTSKSLTFGITNNIEQLSYNENPKKDVPVTMIDTFSEYKTFKIQVSGLRRLGLGSEGEHNDDCITLDVSGNMRLSELRRHLSDKIRPTKPIHRLKFPGRSSPISEKWIDVFTIPVQVTSGRPCYNKSSGYKINTEQSIAAFFTKAYPTPISAKLRQYPQQMQSSTGMSHSVIVGRSDDPNLHISLMRTIRVKGDEGQYTQPIRLGTFPLFDTFSHKDKLPTNVTAKGGLFFPMHEKEAISMCFSCDESTDFAVRPFVGGINGITGDSILSYSSEPDSSIQTARQDYITVPAQIRLDGIATRPGVVKQFVATRSSPTEQHQGPGTLTLPASNSAPSESNVQGAGKIADESRTIEWQKTGKDETGGIQLQIIPKFETKRMFAGSVKDVCPSYFGDYLESYQPVPIDAKVYDVLKTPRELGLHDGDTIHVRAPEKFACGIIRTKLIQDLVAEAPETSGSLYEIKLEVYGEYRESMPISNRNRAGFPWPLFLPCLWPFFWYSSHSSPPLLLLVMVGEVEVFRGFPMQATKLKAILHDKLGILPNRQIFEHHGIEFTGELTNPRLYDKIGKLTLELVVRPYPQPTLGIGAGVSIIQHIHPDTSDPRLWDLASSKILHIQIISAEVFDSIVGSPPSETRIGSKTDSGKERDDSTGVFDGLVSVEEPDRIEAAGKEIEDGDNSVRIAVSPITLLEADQMIPQFKGQYR